MLPALLVGALVGAVVVVLALRRGPREAAEQKANRPSHAPAKAADAAPRAPDTGRIIVNGWDIEICLVADREDIMLGEPIYLSFMVRNHSDQDLQLTEGGDYRNRLGRPESYSVTAFDEDGKPVPQPDAGQTMGGMLVPHKIPSKGSYVNKLFLPNWAAFNDVGGYLIVCRRTLNLTEHTPGKSDSKAKRLAVDVQASTRIKVVRPDKRRLGERIAALAETMLGENHDAAEEATRALAHVDDERVIEHFIKAIETKGYSIKFNALGALVKFDSSLALEGLKKGMSDENNNIRHTTAVALSRSAHPKAKGLLLSMRQDAYEGVRLTVVHALSKMKSPEAESMLKSMTRDPSTMVSGEAQRYLKEHASQTAK